MGCDEAPDKQQPLSVHLHQSKQSTLIVDGEDVRSQHTGHKTQYETADQVVSYYQNLNFMPAKNEGVDKLNMLKMSNEFNPIMEFEINNSPLSSHRTSNMQGRVSYGSGGSDVVGAQTNLSVAVSQSKSNMMP